MTIGERIKKIREEKGMTQQQVADKIGISYQNVSQYERGIRTPKSSSLRKIADALGVDVWEIIEFDNIEVDDWSTDTRPASVLRPSDLRRQRVPLVGSVAAGAPIYDPEDAGVYVESSVDCDAAITVRGDSMAPTYQDGDLVFIKCRPDVPEGAVAVVFLDDEAVLKHVYKRPTGLTLWSDNPEYQPMWIEFSDYSVVRVFGVPVGFLRIFKKGIDGKIKKGF